MLQFNDFFQNIFWNLVKRIEDTLGINLSTIELVGLRNIFLKTAEEKVSGEEFDFEDEAFVRFVFVFYGLIWEEVKLLYPLFDKGGRHNINWPPEELKSYFRFLQFKSHLF